jgi:CcmD family protein
LEGLYSFLQNNAIYIVMVIVLIVWTGIFFYLLNLDKRIKSFEKEFKNKKNEFVE